MKNKGKAGVGTTWVRMGPCKGNRVPGCGGCGQQHRGGVAWGCNVGWGGGKARTNGACRRLSTNGNCGGGAGRWGGLRRWKGQVALPCLGTHPTNHQQHPIGVTNSTNAIWGATPVGTWGMVAKQLVIVNGNVTKCVRTVNVANTPNCSVVWGNGWGCHQMYNNTRNVHR